MSEEKETIEFEKKDSSGWFYFSRPERMNALSPDSIRELWTKMSKLEADPEIKVAVFSGRGEAFCAGMDMAGLERATPLAARRRSREIQMLTNRIADFSMPTIAAVNGVAMGVGLEICLACDMVIASEAARFAFPDVKLGMIPCGGGTQRLARLVGLRRARDMIFTGRILDADLAQRWGLVNEVAGPGELSGKVEDLAERLATGGRIALYQAKRCINHSMDMDMNRGLEYETECFTTCFSSGEPAAALKSYAEADTGGTEGKEPDSEEAPPRPEKAVAEEEAVPEEGAEEKSEEEPASEDEEEEGDIFE